MYIYHVMLSFFATCRLEYVPSPTTHRDITSIIELSPLLTKNIGVGPLNRCYGFLV